MVWNRKFLNSRGQSTVEYILLLSVLISLALIVFHSDAFKKFFSEDSEFFSKLVERMEYSYRHGRLGKGNDLNFQKHQTYFNKDENRSRFFSPAEKYP